MRSLVIFGCVVALAVAQRPSYAGTSQKVYPELHSRFKDTETSNSQSSVDTNSIANRIGETESQTTIKIPIDARGDEELVKWLNTWPRENRPFWLLNAEHIEKFRDPQGSRNKQQQVRLRSSFDDDDDFSPFDDKYVKPTQSRPSFLSSLGRL
ncbi:uncharacterized protein LOC108907392 [Anoplophora glabripennis]|uniref:uncharacterized protein LOC108907392 n=1 Tax=Anoplophora glabripennis TaxID=217634 RepID=UPI0008754EB5|nr:uncharacterized protein LOC108907392 [Anoplophora glabripennis]